MTPEAEKFLPTLVGRLQADLEAARLDAERYRWLRDKASGAEWERIGHGTTPETTDAVIDAEIAMDLAAKHSED